jgi:hypothetical protein
MCELQVSGNETSSSNADRSMRKGKTPMNEHGEEQLSEPELQNLKLHDNLGNEIAHHIIAISDTVIPWNIIPYPHCTTKMTPRISAFAQYAMHFHCFHK